MEIRIKLETEEINYLELDLYGVYCSLPVIMDDKMIIGNHLACLDAVESTYNQLPEELKKILDKRGTKTFNLKSSVFTITGLTAYEINVGNPGEKGICAEKIFDNFDKNKKVHSITPTCSFPFLPMLICFQTRGDMLLEFDLEDVYFTDSYEEWYEILMKKKEELMEINKEKCSNYLEEIEERRYT